MSTQSISKSADESRTLQMFERAKKNVGLGPAVVLIQRRLPEHLSSQFNFEEWLEIYGTLGAGQELKKKACESISQKVQTKEQWQEVYKRAQRDSEMERLASKHIEALEPSTSLPEWTEIFTIAPIQSCVEDIALKNIERQTDHQQKKALVEKFQQLTSSQDANMILLASYKVGLLAQQWRIWPKI